MCVPSSRVIKSTENDIRIARGGDAQKRDKSFDDFILLSGMNSIIIYNPTNLLSYQMKPNLFE